MRRPLSLFCAALLTGTLLGGVSDEDAQAEPGRPAPANTRLAAADELLVGYVPGATETARGRSRGRVTGQLAERVARGSGRQPVVDLVRLPRGRDRAQAIRELEQDPAVAYAEPNWIYTHTATSTDPYYTNGNLWGMSGRSTRPANAYGSNAAAAWAAGKTGSATVYVGVIDEGIQYNHPDLAGQVRNPKERAGNRIDDDRNGYVDDVYGWDFAGNNASVYDGGTSGSTDDHGTHVAGTIGAKANGAGVVGVNWNVRLISGKFLGADGGTAANAIKAIDYFTGLKQRGVTSSPPTTPGAGVATPRRCATPSPGLAPRASCSWQPPGTAAATASATTTTPRRATPRPIPTAT